MKNPLHKRNRTKLALCAGAAALAALAPQTHAQSNDALIDKLEAKGILSADEAKDLRAESDKDFKTAVQSKTGMPDWVTSWKIFGDFRGRADQMNATDNSTATDRLRWRYRLRVGMTANIIDNMEVGFRLASGDVTNGRPTGNSDSSGNSSFQDNGSKKDIFVDTAYAKWTAINSGDWLMAATIGKMDSPFSFTPMVIDADYTPEGAALTTTYNINDQQSVTLVGGAFVLDEEPNTTQDPYLYAGQVLLNSKWSKKWSTSLGFGMLDISNPQQLTAGNPGNVPFINQGNTYNAGGVLLYHYNSIVGDACVTYKMDSFPLYPGECPIKVGAEIIDNTAVNNNNMGYWVGATLGKAGGKRTWDLSYRYEWLEADAWYCQLVDDDNAAFYQNPGTGNLNGAGGNPGGRGYYGGTNVRGHLVKFNYCITDYLMLSLTGYLTDLINANNQQSPAASNVAEPNSSAIHFMADLTWKF